MTFDSFFDLMVSVFVTLLQIIQRGTTLNSLIVKLILECKEKNIVIGKSVIQAIEGSESTVDHALSPKRKNDDVDDDLGSVDFDEEDAIRENIGVNALDSALDGTDGAASAFKQMVDDANDVLHSISDLSNARSAKLINVRSDQNARLNPKDFYRLLNATREFIAGEEVLCGYHGIGLKGAMMTQVICDNFFSCFESTFFLDRLGHI
jgi:hypothetical protein